MFDTEHTSDIDIGAQAGKPAIYGKGISAVDVHAAYQIDSAAALDGSYGRGVAGTNSGGVGCVGRAHLQGLAAVSIDAGRTGSTECQSISVERVGIVGTGGGNVPYHIHTVRADCNVLVTAAITFDREQRT